MKKLLVLLLAVVLVVAVSAPPASADGARIWQGRGGWGGEHMYHGGGCVGCGFLGGLLLGGILGGVLAAPYVAPPPVSAPEPTCYVQPGYWAQVPYARPDGYTMYRNVWVPPQTVCR
jgi:hypothetical protein